MAVGQRLRYAELTCTPYTSVRPHEDGVGMPIEAYTEALEDARVAAERDFGLVLGAMPHCGRIPLAAVEAPVRDGAARRAWAEVVALGDDRVGLVVADGAPRAV